MVSYWPLNPLSCRISVNNNQSNEGVLTKQLFQDFPHYKAAHAAPRPPIILSTKLGPGPLPQPLLHLFCHFDNYNVICNIQLRWSRWTGCNGARRHLHYKPLVKRKWSLFICASSRHVRWCSQLVTDIAPHLSTGPMFLARVCDSLTPVTCVILLCLLSPLPRFIPRPETHFIWS